MVKTPQHKEGKIHADKGKIKKHGAGQKPYVWESAEVSLNQNIQKRPSSLHLPSVTKKQKRLSTIVSIMVSISVSVISGPLMAKRIKKKDIIQVVMIYILCAMSCKQTVTD